jgi:uncharacterized protein YbcI
LSRPTKGSIEAEVANAVNRFQREQHGRGPADVRAHLIGDLILVRTSGIFTQTETHLSASEEGRKLIKSAREELRSLTHVEIENTIEQIVGCKVLYSHYDVNAEVAGQVEVYVLEHDVERRLLHGDLNRLGGMEKKGSAG